ncbi:MAG: hypothetical protein WCF45_17265, partial [Photobacterium halotolerans]
MIKNVRHFAVAGCTLFFVGCAEPEKQAVNTPDEATRPDFNVMEDVNLKKQSFFTFLRPFVQQENARV